MSDDSRTGPEPNLPRPGARPEAPPAPAAAPQQTMAGLLGEVVTLFAASPTHKFLFLADLEWLVMPPLLLSQFRTFRAGEKLAGLALWARVSGEVEERLAAGNPRLQPAEWQSGNQLWLMELVAPFGGQPTMLEDLQANAFHGKPFKMIGVGEDGQRKLVTVGGT